MIAVFGPHSGSSRISLAQVQVGIGHDNNMHTLVPLLAYELPKTVKECVTTCHLIINQLRIAYILPGLNKIDIVTPVCRIKMPH